MDKIKEMNNAEEIKDVYKDRYYTLCKSSDLSELNAIKVNLEEDKEYLNKIISKGLSDFKDSLLENEISVNRLMKIAKNALQDELSFINHYDDHLIDDLRKILNKMNEYSEYHLDLLYPAIDAHKKLRKITLEVEAIREISHQVKKQKIHGDQEKKSELSVDEKIELWIDEHIPNSPNKMEYHKAFKVICEQENPKDCGIPFLLDKIHEEFEPSIGDQSIRKKIPNFKNTFPF